MLMSFLQTTCRTCIPQVFLILTHMYFFLSVLLVCISFTCACVTGCLQHCLWFDVVYSHRNALHVFTQHITGIGHWLIMLSVNSASMFPPPASLSFCPPFCFSIPPPSQHTAEAAYNAGKNWTRRDSKANCHVYQFSISSVYIWNSLEFFTTSDIWPRNNAVLHWFCSRQCSYVQIRGS